MTSTGKANQKLAEEIFENPPENLRDRVHLLKIARNILGWGSGFQYLDDAGLLELIKRKEETPLKRRPAVTGINRRKK